MTIDNKTTKTKYRIIELMQILITTINKVIFLIRPLSNVFRSDKKSHIELSQKQRCVIKAVTQYKETIKCISSGLNKTKRAFELIREQSFVICHCLIILSRRG